MRFCDATYPAFPKDLARPVATTRFPDILARSAFSRTELLTYEYDAVFHPSIDAAIGFHYSLGNVLARLGDQRSRPTYEPHYTAPTPHR